MQLPEITCQDCCIYNGKQLKLPSATIGYLDQPILFEMEKCTLETEWIYGLIGPNGSGKSSLARAITAKAFPGFPDHFTTVYLDCCSTETASEGLMPCDYIIEGIQTRLKQIKRHQEELELRLEEEEDMEEITSKLAALYEQEDELTTSTTEEIQQSLRELEFEQANLLNTTLGQLSSGWKYKCRVIRALLAHPDLLVLDEPSFLDEESLDWLCHRLRRIANQGAMIVLISHKEKLLQQLCSRILFISAAHKLEQYNCDYETFVALRENETTHATKQIEKGVVRQTNAVKSLKKVQQKLAKSEKNNAARIAGGKVDRRFVQGKSIEAKQKGDKSAAAKVKQLQKEADKLNELEKNAKVHEFKAIPLIGNAWAISQPMITVEDVTFSYDTTEITPLLDIHSLAVYGNDRISLAGTNGSGKSTLLKLLVGDLLPTSGTIHRASALRIAYFPQNALEHLLIEHGNKTPIKLLQTKWEISDLKGRMHLGRFGIRADMATNPIQRLSAGQRTRLYLSVQFGPDYFPSLLILDEVENLDSETTKALLDSLSEFQGTVVCVSHDQEHLKLFQPRQYWRLDKGKISVEFSSD